MNGPLFSTVVLRIDRELQTVEITATGPYQENNIGALAALLERSGGLAVLLDSAPTKGDAA